MAERWFFALWPDPLVAPILGRLRLSSPSSTARWAHPLDLHLTLVFIGELDPGRLACVEAAADAVSAPAFPVRIDRVDIFSHNRVLWCGPSEYPDALLRLVEGLQGQLESCGIRPERRPYRAHVTLARGFAQPLPSFAFGPVEWTARDFALACGRSGEMPRYEIRRRWPLVDSSSPI